MEKRTAPWWLSALTAVLCVACAAAWFHSHRSVLDGLDIMVVLVWLTSGVVWSVRAMRGFLGRNNKK